MKKIFASMTIATALATSTMAQEPPDQDIILNWDNDIMILQDGGDSFKTINTYHVMCPRDEDPMSKLYASNGEIVILTWHWSAASAQKQIEQAPFLKKYEDPHAYTGRNFGFVKPDGQIEPTYNIDQGTEGFKNLLKDPKAMMGADINNPDIVRNLRKFALTFCGTMS